MYKVHIIFHKIKASLQDDYVERLQDHWDKRIKPAGNADIKITFSETYKNEVVDFKFFSLHSSGKNCYGTVNGKTITRDYVKANQYHQVVFVHDGKLASNYKEIVADPNNFVNSFSFYEELFPNTEYTEVVLDKNTQHSLNAVMHETMHAIAKKLYRAGINEWIDHMDGTVVDGKWVNYYLNSNPSAPDGNYSRTINAITKAHGWHLVWSDRRNMYQFAKVKGESTIVVKRNDKWFELVTPPDGWEIVKRELKITDPIPEISRSEVQGSFGGQGRFGIIFDG